MKQMCRLCPSSLSATVRHTTLGKIALIGMFFCVSCVTIYSKIFLTNLQAWFWVAWLIHFTFFLRLFMECPGWWIMPERTHPHTITCTGCLLGIFKMAQKHPWWQTMQLRTSLYDNTPMDKPSTSTLIILFLLRSDNYLLVEVNELLNQRYVNHFPG